MIYLSIAMFFVIGIINMKSRAQYSIIMLSIAALLTILEAVFSTVIRINRIWAERDQPKEGLKNDI